MQILHPEGQYVVADKSVEAKKCEMNRRYLEQII